MLLLFFLCLSLLCLSASITGCFSFPAPLTFLRCSQRQKNNSAHILLGPEGHKICSSADNRKPLKDSVICKSGRGVTLLGSQRTNGKGALEGSVVRWGSEVACVRGWKEKEWEFGSRASCFDTAWEKEWIKDKICQWESEHVWKMFAPTFSSAAQGGYSHCLEVFSCVPLGPTRRLVTHLKVSFSVVQHHLKD